MTKDEAINIFTEKAKEYRPARGQVEHLIDAFAALGMLKLDEPKDPNQIFMSAVGDIPMERRDCGALLAAINKAGLKLVEK